MRNVMALVNVKSPSHPAVDMARALVSDEDDRIELVAAIPRVPQLLHALWSSESRNYERDRLADTQSVLAEIAQDAGTSTTPPRTYVVQGVPFVEIIHLADRNKTHVLVTDDSIDLPAEYGAAPEYTNFRLLRKCPCPVMLVRSNPCATPKKIVAAVDVQDVHSDGVELNAKIVQHAAGMARQFGAELHVLQAWEFGGAGLVGTAHEAAESDALPQAYLSRVRAEVERASLHAGSAGVHAHVHVLEGPPESVIQQFVEGETIDLLVMGTVARSGLPGFIMGNTAEKILNRVHCSVYALKPDGFCSPVLQTTS